MFGPMRTFQSVLVELEQGLRNGEIKLRDAAAEAREIDRAPEIMEDTREVRHPDQLNHEQAHGPRSVGPQ